MPDTRVGTTFGHEFTGVVEQAGPEVQKLKGRGQGRVLYEGDHAGVDREN